MDDLQQAVARNLSVREAEAEPARAIVREEVARFEDWLASLDVVPTISALRRRGDQIVEQVLARERVRLGVAVGGGPRAAGGDGARGREPAAARAHGAAQGRPLETTPPTAT